MRWTAKHGEEWRNLDWGDLFAADPEVIAKGVVISDSLPVGVQILSVVGSNGATCNAGGAGRADPADGVGRGGTS